MPAVFRALIFARTAGMPQLLGDVLRTAGAAQVTVVRSVEDAKDRSQYGGFSLAVIELDRGDDDALEFVRFIRTTPEHPCQRMPLLVISACGELGCLNAAREAGADAYVVKPLRRDTLLRNIERLLAGPVIESRLRRRTAS